ncbi:MAG: A/G-specific adenine glycosylase [Lentisphaeria bacterium]|nr:A/G-specific adenine glycosylase [Lentisphaeria bacterium]
MTEVPEEAVAPLLAWYDANRRVLPWRDRPTPYRVWVSEIMLQQTRVEAVKPYYERFMRELPTVEELASVDDERLMKLWEGLGYYSRARNLKKAAQAIVSEFGGVFPRSREGLLALPGVGDYTAGAVASIAMNLPEPAVDGNVLRVISRLTGSREDIAKPQTKQAVSDALRQIYPAGRSGDFTQSLMELGATVCLPNGEPMCLVCPWMGLCRARREGSTDEIPVKAAKKARGIEAKTVLLLRCGEKAAFHRRPKSGLLAGMWELPNAAGALSAEEALTLAGDWGIGPLKAAPAGKAVHIFTHREWHMNAFRIDCGTMPGMFRWVCREEFETELALPSAFRGFLEALWR